MSEHSFGLYNGHLSLELIQRVEKKFPHVAVINYKDPNGTRRGWFSGPNRGAPFDDAMSEKVLAFAREIATGKDRVVLGCEEE